MRAVLLICITLAGCSATPAYTCVSPGMFVGDKIKNLETGKTGTLKARYGESWRCSDVGHPILADVAYE